MRRIFLAATMLFLILSQTGCGDHHNARPTIVTHILSDPAFDGDIELDTSNVFTITQGSATAQTVFAGIDPFTLSEFRAFLDFPLSGSGGVPSNAVIVSATLDIVIDSVQPSSGSVPILIDLVSFFPLTLFPTDFDRTIQPALASTRLFPPISGRDVGNHVIIDVTSLMTQAQNQGLADFQIRILEDLEPVSPGLIEIDDTTGADRASFAPLLTVTYF